MRKLNLFKSNKGFEEYYIVKINAKNNYLEYGHYLPNHQNKYGSGCMTIGYFLESYKPSGILDVKIQSEIDYFTEHRAEIEYKTSVDANLFYTIRNMANNFVFDGESFADHSIGTARHIKKHIEKYSKVDVDFHSVLNYLKQRIGDMLLNYESFNRLISESCVFQEAKNIKTFIKDEFNDYYGTTTRDVYNNIKRIWEAA